MSFALKWEPDETQAGGFVYFDAVTSYSRSYKASVTKHPVDGGGNITDHFIKDNPAFTLSVVISSIDIATFPNSLTDSVGDQPYNTRPSPDAVSVNSTDRSVLTKYLPDSIGQFLPDKRPDIVMAEKRDDTNQSAEDLLVSLITGAGVNIITGLPDVSIREVVLYSTEGYSLVKKLPVGESKLVVTSVSFREDANTGIAVYCDISMEQVTFVSLTKTTLPKNVRTTLKAKVASKKNTGRCDSTVKDPDSVDNKDSTATKEGVIKANKDALQSNEVAKRISG